MSNLYKGKVRQVGSTNKRDQRVGIVKLCKHIQSFLNATWKCIKLIRLIERLLLSFQFDGIKDRIVPSEILCNT